MLANSTGILGTPTEQLVLEVHGLAAEVRQFDTAGAKCIIGSGPNCKLRLDHPSVANIHCMLIRGARGTAFRAVAPTMLTLT